MVDFNCTADEICLSGIDTVVLPIGSTEQHGPHLPVSTDTKIAESVAAEICKKLNMFMLQPLPISTCREHMGKKGSVWMNPDTFYNMIKDISASLKEQGFRRLILVLAHGGITISSAVVREINALNTEFKVIRVDLVSFLQIDEMQKILEYNNNLHACEYETSLMFYLYGELVRKDRIRDGTPEVPRDFLNYASIFKYSPNGVWGKPSLATEEKGRKIFDVLVEQSITYINKINQIFKEE